MTQNDIQQKLRVLQSQKRKLRERIKQYQQKEEGQKKYNYEETMEKLLERKKKLQFQKADKQRIKKLEDQYKQRKQQQQREKKILQLQNDKRIIQLQAAIKKAVFQGLQQKAKAMNSQQLLQRIQLRGQYGKPSIPINQNTQETLKKQLQNFIETNQQQKQPIKYDLFELNEKRMKIFQAKQQAIMRLVLIKQYESKTNDYDKDVMKLSRKQLQQEIQKHGINIRDFLHQIPKQQIIQNISTITKNAESRIDIKKKLIEQQQKLKKQSQQYIRELKNSLKAHDAQSVKIVRKIVMETINEAVSSYQKRLTAKTTKQNQSLYQQLQQQYNQIINKEGDQIFAQMIVQSLMKDVHKQMSEESTQQIWLLNQFTHSKTQQCLEWLIKGDNMLEKILQAQKNQIQLNFNEEGQQKAQIIKNNKYLNKFQQIKSNIFDVDELTIELVNDVQILEIQDKYFTEVMVNISNQKQVKNTPFLLYYDNEPFIINHKAIHRLNKNIKILNLKINEKSSIQIIKKFNQNWLIVDSDKITLHTKWCQQELPYKIGDRMDNKVGKITTCDFFPMTTLLGSICSIIIGFQKGQILKYNYNTDRITHQQTNITYYQPIIGGVKTGNQPTFPLQYQGLIQVKNKKFKQGDTLHEFRQFFDYHTTKIVGLCFYRHNNFITIDSSMKCAIWVYDIRQGPKSYEPVFTFEFVCTFKVYKQAQDPKYKSIFPNNDIKQTPQELYKQWMQSDKFLKKQIYNNPKKQNVYFIPPTNDSQNEQEIPLWKISYDENKKRINKIYQANYRVYDGSMEGKCCKIWKNYLFIMCQRDHVIRSDLKSIKIYGWNIQERRMRSIGIQFDMFKNQTEMDFVVLDKLLPNINMQILAVLSSGRILLFSMISGQLLRNFSDQRFLVNVDYAKTFFTSIINGPSYFAASTNDSFVEINLIDKNTTQNQNQLNNIIKATMKKFVNLI